MFLKRKKIVYSLITRSGLTLRFGLLSKFIACGVSGKVFKVIRIIYQCVKSCNSMNGNKSDYFMSVGVRQGENLSPLLFTLYINDLENFMVDKNVNPVTVTRDLTYVYGWIYNLRVISCLLAILNEFMNCVGQNFFIVVPWEIWYTEKINN